MTEIFNTYIGYIAATLTTLAFVPQALKIISSGDTKAISLSMYAMFCGGVFCWLCYGVVIDSIPIIIANTVTLLLASTVLYFKLRNDFCTKNSTEYR